MCQQLSGAVAKRSHVHWCIRPAWTLHAENCFLLVSPLIICRCLSHLTPAVSCLLKSLPQGLLAIYRTCPDLTYWSRTSLKSNWKISSVYMDLELLAMSKTLLSPIYASSGTSAYEINSLWRQVLQTKICTARRIFP